MVWFRLEPRPGFNKATVSAWRASLGARKLGSSFSDSGILGNQKETSLIFVSRLTAKTYNSKQRIIGLNADTESWPKDLPKYMLYQPFAAVSSARYQFFLLQCRTRGAKLVPQTVSRARWLTAGLRLKPYCFEEPACLWLTPFWPSWLAPGRNRFNKPV